MSNKFPFLNVSCVRGLAAGVLNEEYAEYEPPNEGASATPMGWQVASSASELPLWGSKILRVILIEGAVSIHSLKRNKITRFITQKSQKRGRVQ